MTATPVDALVTPDEGAVADAARRVASWAEGPARINIYKVAKQEIAAATERAAGICDALARKMEGSGQADGAMFLAAQIRGTDDVD